jgi:hypothetical protein
MHLLYGLNQLPRVRTNHQASAMNELAEQVSRCQTAQRTSAAILGPIASIVISIAVNYDNYCQFAIQLLFARIPVIWPTHLSDF